MTALHQRNEIPSFVIRDLLMLGHDLGLNTDSWASHKRHGYMSDDGEASTLPWQTCIDTIEAAVSEHPHIPFGLIIARWESLSSYGLLGFAIMSAPSLQDALLVGVRHHQLAGSLTDIGFQLTGDQVSLFLDFRLGTPSLVKPFLCEEMFGGLLNCIRDLVGDYFSPLSASFPYPEPAYGAQYEDLFKTDCQFNASRCEMRFPAKWLNIPLPSGNAISFRQSLDLCEKLNTTFQPKEKDWVAELGILIGSRLNSLPTLGEIALKFNMSERTLRRKLKEEGFTYRNLLASVRLNSADNLLRSGMKVEEVAAKVGFSEAREFRRAFKRFAGMTPSQAKGM